MRGKQIAMVAGIALLVCVAYNVAKDKGKVPAVVR